MSLLEAMLLEPFRDPRVVWIARRADRQVGCGTVDDPYDGSSVGAPPIRLVSVTNSGKEATATTEVGHGFLDGEVVSISEVSGADAAIWNGTFVVFGAAGSTFKYTMAAEPGTAPGLSALSAATRQIYRFDEVMRTLKARTAVHIGPGVFETRGFNPGRLAPMDRLNWIIRSGQKISGAGMGVTTLKLVFAEPFFDNATLTLAISHGAFSPPDYSANADDAEVCDLTIDCDMRSQPGDRVAKGAIFVGGKHVRIRWVRAVDFCTQFSPAECFVITTAGADPRTSPGGIDPKNPFTERVDCRIEDCVLEQPGLNGLYTITGLSVSSGERPDTGEMGWHRACALRNNYANLEYQDNPVSIAGITVSAGVATVTTRTPHERQTGDCAVISGALVDGSEFNTFNGTYPITCLDEYSFSYTPVAYSGLPVPTTPPTGEMWLGRYSSRLLKVVNLELTASPPTRRIRLTTSRPHNRVPSNYVNVSGVRAVGFPDDRFDGRFAIAAVVSPVKLEFDIDEDLTSSPVFTSFGITGSALQVLSGDGGSEAIVEGNRIFHCLTGGPYHDTWSSKDVTVRQNYNHDVITGPHQALRPGITTTPHAWVALKSLQYSGDAGTGFTAIAETFKPHGLKAAVDTVDITEASVAVYNGSKVPVTAVTATTFAYALSGDPGGSATGAKYLIQDLLVLIESLVIGEDSLGYFATATTFNHHGFLKGDGVLIIKAGHFDLGQYPKSTLFNGFFAISDVLDENRFRYRLDDNPGVDSGNAAFAAGYFGRLWQSRISVYEDNLFELSGRLGDDAPFAIGVFQGDPVTFVARTNPYTYHQLIARGNLMQSVDTRYGMVDTSYSSGIRFTSCKSALVERNVIDVGPSAVAPIDYRQSGVVRTGRNQTPAGLAVPGLDAETKVRSDNLASRVVDAEVLSLF